MKVMDHAGRLKVIANRAAGTLVIHEIYRSIQGESAFAGLPCVFVRLAGCHLRCRWCDTPHAFGEGTAMELDHVVARIRAEPCDLVEITGGEPLLQSEVFSLMRRLADAGYTVLLETGGAVSINEVDHRVHIIMDLKCPGSGECSRNMFQNLERLKPSDEVKFVIADRNDFDWSCAQVRSRELLKRFGVLFSPVFGELELETLARWILEAGIAVRLQPQLHKFIWDPEARGV